MYCIEQTSWIFFFFLLNNKKHLCAFLWITLDVWEKKCIFGPCLFIYAVQNDDPLMNCVITESIFAHHEIEAFSTDLLLFLYPNYLLKHFPHRSNVKIYLHLSFKFSWGLWKKINGVVFWADKKSILLDWRATSNQDIFR